MFTIWKNLSDNLNDRQHGALNIYAKITYSSKRERSLHKTVSAGDLSSIPAAGQEFFTHDKKICSALDNNSSKNISGINCNLLETNCCYFSFGGKGLIPH